MQVIPCRTKVKIKDIEGVITGISIRDEQVSYEVTYWVGSERKQEWLAEYEFKVGKVNKQEIGFKAKEEK